MLNRIIEYAKNKGVKLVAMNGSRVNENIIPDVYQDYDVVFFVDNIHNYIFEPEVFGVVLISQTNWINDKVRIMMVQYVDGNRIDLQIRAIADFDNYLQEDSLTKIIYNKTGIDFNITTSDIMHRLVTPSSKVFSEHINEMYWVCLYVAKALKRGQMNYASHLMVTIILEELSYMLGYNVNIKHDREINYGSNFKYLGHFLEEGEQYYFSLYTRPVSMELILETLDWYDVLVDNVALAYGFSKPDYHRSIIEYIKAINIKENSFISKM